jgi:hypothetical protein
MNIDPVLARKVGFDFPWRRTFEIEAIAPVEDDDPDGLQLM